MTADDRYIAGLHEAAEIAIATAREFGKHGAAAEVVMRRIRARMAQYVEDTMEKELARV